MGRWFVSIGLFVLALEGAVAAAQPDASPAQEASEEEVVVPIPGEPGSETAPPDTDSSSETEIETPPEPLPLPPPPSPSEPELPPEAPRRSPFRCARNPFDDIQDIDELDLDYLLRGEMTMSVSRTRERADDAPASVTVVTREQMRMWGYQSVAELLEHTVGFYGVDDNIIPSFGVRGVIGGLRSESGLLRVMIDGRPIAFRPTGGNWLGPEMIPLSAVERIEIVRGPTSTVYGADAFLGVVNVITRASDRVCGGEIWGTGTYAGGPGGGLDMTIAGRYEDFSALVAVRLDRLDRSGLRMPLSSPAPRLRRGVMIDEPADLVMSSATVLARLTYHLSRRSDITLTSHLSVLDRGGDFAEWVQLAAGLDSNARTRGTQISLARGHFNAAANIEVDSSLSFSANAGLFLGAPTDSDHIDVGSEVSYARRVMRSYAGIADFSAQWAPIEQLRLVLGGDFLLDHQALPGVERYAYSQLGAIDAGGLIAEASRLQPDRDFINAGAFALGTWTPTGDLPGHMMLRVDAGLRYDYNNIYDNRVNGRLASTLRVMEELSLKASYSTAFRAPTTQLLFGQALVPGDTVGNPGLRPQQIHAAEVSATLKPWPWLRLTTGVSYSHLENIASFVRIGVNSVARNVAQLDVVSWETEARVSWDSQLDMYTSFALVGGARDLQERGFRAELVGTDLEAYPPAILNGGVAVHPRGIPLRLTAEARFISDRRSSERNSLENGAPYTLPAAFYLDASVALVEVELLSSHLSTFVFSVRNILDTQAAHPGFGGFDLPSAPRTFMLQWQQEL